MQLIVNSFLFQELNQWEPYNLKRLVVGSISCNQHLVSFFMNAASVAESVISLLLYNQIEEKGAWDF